MNPYGVRDTGSDNREGSESEIERERERERGGWRECLLSVLLRE